MIDHLRRNKLATFIYNLLHFNTLKANKSLYKKYGLKKSVTASVSSHDFPENHEEKPWLDVQDSRNALKENDFYNSLDTATQSFLSNWSQDGFAVIPGFYSENEIETIESELEKITVSKKGYWRHRDKKLMFAIHHSDKLKNTVGKKPLLDILSLLLGKKAKLFQSINFWKGSEQPAHSDSIHMTTFPEGFLIAVWIALEDLGPDNGPLYYYPGSHRLKPVLIRDFDHGGNNWRIGNNVNSKFEKQIAGRLKESDLKPIEFHPRKGDILIWHSNLIHGGKLMNNPELTRKSMVLHLYAEGVICYHDISQRPAIIR